MAETRDKAVPAVAEPAPAPAEPAPKKIKFPTAFTVLAAGPAARVGRLVHRVLSASDFAAGSMGPKVRAACWFAERTGRFAAIGAIGDTQGLLAGEPGTRVALDAAGASAVGTA